MFCIPPHLHEEIFPSRHNPTSIDGDRAEQKEVPYSKSSLVLGVSPHQPLTFVQSYAVEKQEQILCKSVKDYEGLLPVYEKSKSTRRGHRHSTLADEPQPKSRKRFLFPLFLSILALTIITIQQTSLISFKNNLPSPLYSYFSNHQNLDLTHPIDPSFISNCHSLLIPPEGTHINRLNKLSKILPKNKIWISEPSPSAFYFLNGFSKDEWFLSERPFLIIISSSSSSLSSSSNEKKISLLVPSFEKLRANLIVNNLPKEVREKINWIEWKEDQSPYEILNKYLENTDVDEFILDDNVREFIAHDLRSILKHDENGLQDEIRLIREKKNDWEIGLLRCANQFTLHAIRKTRERMYFGITESQTSKILEEEMSKTGLIGGEGLVLFGEDAALPHGSGTDRRLTKEDLILIDAGGKWGEYVSDITRTFALPDSEIPKSHIELWETVRKAQKAPYELLLSKNGSLTFGELDKSAREVVTQWKNKEAKLDKLEEDDDIDFSIFTHRLGHGIGLEGHESPYVIQGSKGNKQIEKGNVFSLEPGIYLPLNEKKVNGLNGIGVRLEDCFALSRNEDGQWEGEWLSGPVDHWGDI